MLHREVDQRRAIRCECGLMRIHLIPSDLNLSIEQAMKARLFRNLS